MLMALKEWWIAEELNMEASLIQPSVFDYMLQLYQTYVLHSPLCMLSKLLFHFIFLFKLFKIYHTIKLTLTLFWPSFSFFFYKKYGPLSVRVLCVGICLPKWEKRVICIMCMLHYQICQSGQTKTSSFFFSLSNEFVPPTDQNGYFFVLH